MQTANELLSSSTQRHAAGRKLLGKLFYVKFWNRRPQSLPTSLVFVVLPTICSLKIVEGGITTTFVKDVTTSRQVTGIKHKSQHTTDSESQSTGEGEFEIDEYPEDEFAETQPY